MPVTWRQIDWKHCLWPPQESQGTEPALHHHCPEKGRISPPVWMGQQCFLRSTRAGQASFKHPPAVNDSSINTWQTLLVGPKPFQCLLTPQTKQAHPTVSLRWKDKSFSCLPTFTITTLSIFSSSGFWHFSPPCPGLGPQNGSAGCPIHLPSELLCCRTPGPELVQPTEFPGGGWENNFPCIRRLFSFTKFIEGIQKHCCLPALIIRRFMQRSLMRERQRIRTHPGQGFPQVEGRCLASLVIWPEQQQSCCGPCRLKEIWKTSAMHSLSRSTCTQHWLAGPRKISCLAPALTRKQQGSSVATAETSLWHCPGLGSLGSGAVRSRAKRDVRAELLPGRRKRQQWLPHLMHSRAKCMRIKWKEEESRGGCSLTPEATRPHLSRQSQNRWKWHSSSASKQHNMWNSAPLKMPLLAARGGHLPLFGVLHEIINEDAAPWLEYCGNCSYLLQ